MKPEKKFRLDLPYYDKDTLKHVEVEFTYPAEDEVKSLSSIGCSFIAYGVNQCKSKEALKHRVEQFCFNNPGVKAEFTGYEE